MVYRIHKFKVSVTEKLIFDCNELMKGIVQSSTGIQSEVHLRTAHIITKV